MSKETITRVFQRRVSMFAAAMDLRDAAKAEVEVLTQRLDAAKAELEQADMLYTRNKSRVVRALHHMATSDPYFKRMDFASRVEYAVKAAEYAREDNLHLTELASLARTA